MPLVAIVALPLVIITAWHSISNSEEIVKEET